MFKQLSFLLFLPLFILVSCVEQQEPEKTKAVIDGWIDSDGYPIVIFTASVFPDEDITSLSDKMIRWGKVTINDGEKEIIMTGGPDKNYFPPYKYYSYEMQGEPGKTYSIKADYRDLHAEASCTMPEPTEILWLTTAPVEGENGLYSAILNFQTPEDVPAYYYVTMREAGSTGRYLPTVMGTYEAIHPGEISSIPLSRPKSDFLGDYTTDDYISQFRTGETFEVKLCRVSKEVFYFWTGYENSILFGGTQFFDSSQSLVGNISGGFGVWSAQGVTKTVLEIK